MIGELKLSEVFEMAAKLQVFIDDGGLSLAEALRLVLEEDYGIMVNPDCNFTKCDHGMGLAGGGGCPGNPCDKDCDEFTTEYSDESVLCKNDPRTKIRGGG